MTVQFKNIRLKRTQLADGRKKIVMVAGTPSHGPGDHEFNAGTMLLKHCLDATPGVRGRGLLQRLAGRSRRPSTMPTRSCSTWTAAAAIR